MIHLLRSIYYGLRSSFKSILTAFLSSFGILFIITFLIIYLSFRTSIRDFIDENLLGSLEIDEIEILPLNEKDDNVYAASSRQGAKLTIDQVKAVREMDDFLEVYTLIMLDYRVRLRGEMFGNRTSMILPFFAIEPEFFRNKMPDWEQFYYKPGRPVKMIAPKFTLVMLNNYLYFNGLPQFKIKDLKGFPMEIQIETKRPPRSIPGAEINESKDESKTHTELEVSMFNFTNITERIGAIVPMDFVTYFAKKAEVSSGRWKRGYQYLQFFARVKDIKKLPETVDKLEKLGLQVKSDRGIADKANQVMKIIDAFSITIIGILVLLTIVSIFNANLNVVYLMSHKFSLTRILGVTKIRIILTFIFEAAIVGAIYGIIGYYAGNYLFSYAADYISGFLPDIAGVKFVAQRNTEVFMLSMGLSALVSAASALVPAIFASNINLFKAVRR
ncbi:MAG: ABC transporter permease [Spirochaetes bacterium]|jgi:ABC-type lipoprotein release transport system permease subunit|nr:ABC transporter permease [Spirochaetota bacterium]